MKTVTVFPPAVLLGFSTAGVSTETKAVSPDRAESSACIVEGTDAGTYVTQNRSFRFAEILDDTGNQEALLILEETYHNERSDGIYGLRGIATVKAWTVKRGGEREAPGKRKEKGNEGKVADRFYCVTAWDGCDAPIVCPYCSVLTARKLYFSSSDVLEVRGDGHGLLADGYAGMKELRRPPQLQYGTDKQVTQRFSVVSSRQYYDAPQMFVSTQEMVERSLDLRGSPMDFKIVLTYEDRVALRVLVAADAIRPDLAQLPKGDALRAEE